MMKVSIGLMCMALITLMLELTLVRVSDVIWCPNMTSMGIILVTLIVVMLICVVTFQVYCRLRLVATA